MEHDPAEQVFTVRAFAGELPVECFLSARVFQADLSQLHPAFSEDHVHACYELLLCRKGSGYQFIGGTALLLPMLVLIAITQFVIPAPNSPWLMLGCLGSFVLGVGLFNIVAAWLHQYLGHAVTVSCLLTGAAMVAVSCLILYA